MKGGRVFLLAAPINVEGNCLHKVDQLHLAWGVLSRGVMVIWTFDQRTYGGFEEFHHSSKLTYSIR